MRLQARVRYLPGKWITTWGVVLKDGRFYCASDGCFYRKSQYQLIK